MLERLPLHAVIEISRAGVGGEAAGADAGDDGVHDRLEATLHIVVEPVAEGRVVGGLRAGEPVERLDVGRTSDRPGREGLDRELEELAADDRIVLEVLVRVDATSLVVIDDGPLPVG